MEVTRSYGLSAVYRWGLGILLSFLATFILGMAHPKSEIVVGIAFLHYVATLIWAFVLLFGKKFRSTYPDRRKVVSLLLVILLTAAFCLNTLVRIFAAPVPWYLLLVLIFSVNTLLLPFFDALPRWARDLQSFLLGITFLLPVYLAIYLLPLYLIGLLALIAFGISIVTYVPLLLTWYNWRVLTQTLWPVLRCRLFFLAGSSVAVAVITIYCIQYSMVNDRMNSMYERLANDTTFEGPAGLKFAQLLSPGRMEERILKTDFLYAIPEMTKMITLHGEDNFHEYHMGQWHDPLFMIASFCGGFTHIPEDARKQALRLVFNNTYASEQAIIVNEVQTSVEMWPEQHLAYTEQRIRFTPHTPGFNKEEADRVYLTFYLPPGSVVNNFSRWNDKEEMKGELAPFRKDSSDERYDIYTAIHWQEGNRVVVSIPWLLAGESEEIKIGIITPLLQEQSQLVYQPVLFDGANTSKTVQAIKLQCAAWPNEMQLPEGFRRSDNNTLVYSGSYHHSWQLRLSENGLFNTSFSFNGQRYNMAAYTPSYDNFTAKDYYLDINSGWDINIFNQLWPALEQGNVWIYHPEKGIVQMTAANKTALFNQMHTYQFTVFPFNRITHPATAMVITAAGVTGLQWEDIRNTGIHVGLSPFLSENKVRVFDMSKQTSAYLVALRNRSALQYERGDIKRLMSLLEQHSFIRPTDNKQVILGDAGLMFTPATDDQPSPQAHYLLQLFAGNHIRQANYNWTLYTPQTASDSLIKEAALAKVVSPVSSFYIREKAGNLHKYNVIDDAELVTYREKDDFTILSSQHVWILIITGMAVVVILSIIITKATASHT